MFMQCSNKVQEKNAEDPTKGTTGILNELLADEVWLAQVWIECHYLEWIYGIKSMFICSYLNRYVAAGPKRTKLIENIVFHSKQWNDEKNKSEFVGHFTQQFAENGI